MNAKTHVIASTIPPVLEDIAVTLLQSCLAALESLTLEQRVRLAN